jgi:hypothetical protein
MILTVLHHEAVVSRSEPGRERVVDTHRRDAHIWAV